MRHILLVLSMVWAAPALPQGNDLPEALDELGDRLAQAVAPETLGRLRNRPDWWRGAPDPVSGYGARSVPGQEFRPAARHPLAWRGDLFYNRTEETGSRCHVRGIVAH